jgi:hypothetical protein
VVHQRCQLHQRLLDHPGSLRSWLALLLTVHSELRPPSGVDQGRRILCQPL